MNGISVEEFCSTYPSVRALFDGGAVDRWANFKMCEPLLYYGGLAFIFGILIIGLVLVVYKKKNK